MDDDATGQDPEDAEGRASAFRRALDAQAEAAGPGPALIPSGPHDLTAPIDRAQIAEALAEPRTEQAPPEETADAAASDPRTRVPPWSPEINWVDGIPGSAPADSTRSAATAPSTVGAPPAAAPAKPKATGSARTKPGPGRIWIALVASTVVAAAVAVVVFIQIDGSNTAFPSALTTEPQMPGGGAVPAAGATSGKGSTSPTAKATGSASATSKHSPSATPHASADATAKRSATPAANKGAAASSTAQGTASAGTTTPAKGIPASALSNTQTSQCLDTPGSAYSSGAVEQVAACGASTFESWTLTANGQLTQDGGSYCLDDYNWDTSAGSEVDLWPCNGGSNQQWTLASNGAIVGLYSNLCVTTTGQGSSVELEPCNGSTTQKWSWG